MCHDLRWGQTFREVVFQTSESVSAIFLPLGGVRLVLVVIFFHGDGHLMNSTAVSDRGAFVSFEAGFIPG